VASQRARNLSLLQDDDEALGKAWLEFTYDHAKLADK